MDFNNYDFFEGMNEGEKQLYYACLSLESDEFKVIPNILFNRIDDGTNQVDLIAISKKGIFVIEMKDYKGWIFGDENQKLWIQSLMSGNRRAKKYEFRNPVKQNENHIKTIRSILSENGYNDLPIYNVIVFGTDAILKKVTASVDVINISEIRSVFIKYRDIIITNEEINNLYRFLEEKNIKDPIKRQEHLNYINEIRFGKNVHEHYTKNLTDDGKPINSLGERYIRDSSMDFSISAFMQYINKYKKLILVLTILITLYFIKDTQSILFIFILGVIGVKLRYRRAIAVAVILSFVYLISNPFTNKPAISNYERPNTTSSNQRLDTNNKNETKTIPQDKLVSPQDGGAVNSITPPKAENVNDTSVKPLQKSSLHIGSKEDEVSNLLGSPDKKVSSGDNVIWYYSLAYVSFDKDGLVNGWNNYNGVLNAAMQKKIENAKPIDIGSTKDDVLAALGSPYKIDAANINIWYYSLGYVSFDKEGLVNGWNNNNSVLNAAMRKKIENAKPIDIESTKDDVLAALGSPYKIDAAYINIWYYSLGYVSFDKDGLVNGWNNYNGVLNAAMRKKIENAKPIDIGSTKDDVLVALGSPHKIDAANINIWYYSLGYVSFDKEGLVNGWNNYNGILNAAMRKKIENSKLIEIGSTKEVVLNALGSPSKIESNNLKIWWYGLAYISFDDKGLVNGWKEYNNILAGTVRK